MTKEDIIKYVLSQRDRIESRIFKLCRNVNVVPDIYQDLLLSLWKADAQKLAEVKKLDAYIRTIIDNLISDQYRNLTTRGTFTAGELAQLEQIQSLYMPPAPSPSEELETRERVQLFYQSMEALPERQRAVIKLYAEGLSLQAIGKRLGITVSTVKKHKLAAQYQMNEALNLHVMPREEGSDDVES